MKGRKAYQLAGTTVELCVCLSATIYSCSSEQKNRVSNDAKNSPTDQLYSYIQWNLQ